MGTRWILEYQDDRGYLRKRWFGSYKQAMNFIKGSNNILVKVYKEQSITPTEVK